MSRVLDVLKIVRAAERQREGEAIPNVQTCSIAVLKPNFFEACTTPLFRPAESIPILRFLLRAYSVLLNAYLSSQSF